MIWYKRNTQLQREHRSHKRRYAKDYIRDVNDIGLKNMVKLQGCMVNALVSEVDERRDKLR